MDIEAIVNKHSDLAYGTMATDQDKSAIRAALAEQAETHAIELRAYDATVENLVEALRGVFRVADRDTVEFDAAKAAIMNAVGE